MEIFDLLKEIKENYKNIKTIEKINVGFTNEVYSMDDNYIIKICGDKSNQNRFINEIDFYLKNPNNKYIPKLYDHHKANNDNDLSYLIIEKLSGESLYYVWHTFSDEKRKQIISELAEMMKSFHSIEAESLDWSSYISNKIKNNLEICYNKEIIDSELYKRGVAVLEKSSKYLNTTKFSLVHADIHFDNIIYTNAADLKIIDFETAISSPIDYELDIFLRMCNNPFKYASEETEEYVKIEDYQNIENWLKEFYPEIFSNEHFDIRMKYYDLESNIRLLPRFSDNDELKQLVIKIINEIEKSLND